MGKTINVILNLQDKFTRKLTDAQKETLIFKERLKSAERAAATADKAVAAFGRTAAAACGTAAVGIAGFAKAAMDTYGEFQKSMSNVAGILGIDQTSESYEMLSAAAREAGKSTTKTAQESADALSYMALAGWSTADSMKGLMPILRASEATGSELAATSDLVTDSMAALGLGTADMQHYLDLSAKAQNRSNMTLTQLQEAYIEVGGTLQNFNTPLEESAALLGLLANRGLKGSEAGHSLQSTLINLTKKSGESAEAMKQLGLSAYDSEGNFKGVTKVLKELQAATADMTEEQRNTYLTMIGGKMQLTTLNSLMNGLAAVTADGRGEYEALREELENCGGALNKMAVTMTDNYAGALARAGSAVDDLKITVGERLEPYITKMIDQFSRMLPGAAEKVSLFLGVNVPKAVEACKSAFEKIKPAAEFVVKNFGRIVSVTLGVLAGLKSFSIITKVVSLFKKLKDAENALKVVQLALNTSILACPWTWVAVGIGMVVGGLLLYKNAAEEAKRADIASHFGEVALSAEQCERMVKNAVGTRLVNAAEDLKYAWDELDTSLNNLSSTARELNKVTFMAKLSPENVSRDEYVQAAQSYIDAMQEAVRGKRYEIALDIDFLFGKDSDMAAMLSGETNTYFSQMLESAEELGNELAANIAKGYENGWDEQSTAMVAASLKKMSEMQEKIQKAQAAGQMELLTADFLMGDMSEESFDMYFEKLSEQGAALEEAAKTAAANAIAAQKLMFDDGALGIEAYTENVDAITKAYGEKVGESTSAVVSEAMRALRDVFGEEFAAVSDRLNTDLTGVFKVDPENVGESIEQLQGAIEASVSKLDVGSGTKEKIQGYMEKLMPSVNELKKLAAQDPTLWGTYGEAITSAEAMNVLTGAGKGMGEAVVLGAKGSGVLSNAQKAGEAIKAALLKPFGETGKVTLPIEISYTSAGAINAQGDEKISKDNSPWGKIKSAVGSVLTGHATGTTYFGGGYTRINEHGGEIIDLPTGARIYPADKSDKMAKASPSVNVNVNVAGNIYGSEKAAEEIGSLVCTRIVDMIRAV